jgi:hypothetical protein
MVLPNFCRLSANHNFYLAFVEAVAVLGDIFSHSEGQQITVI